MSFSSFSISASRCARAVMNSSKRGALPRLASMERSKSAFESFTSAQRIAGQEFLRPEPFPAFALEFDNAKGLLSASYDDSVPARFQNLAGRIGTPIGNVSLPYLQQDQLRFRGQKRVGAGPWHQSSNAVPQAARGLSPVQASVFLGNLPSIARPGLRLFAGNSSSGDIIQDGFRQQPGPDRGEPVVQRLGVIGRSDGR